MVRDRFAKWSGLDFVVFRDRFAKWSGLDISADVGADIVIPDVLQFSKYGGREGVAVEDMEGIRESDSDDKGVGYRVDTNVQMVRHERTDSSIRKVPRP